MDDIIQTIANQLNLELNGKKIKKVTGSLVEGNFGNEPIITLHFTDGTEHSFVLPSDNW